MTPLMASLIIALWDVAVANTYGPELVTYRPLWLGLKATRKILYIATGISSHAVFEDNGFAHYGYQLRLAVGDPTALQPHTVPYSRSGLFAWSVRDRVWEEWWKRTQAPSVPLYQSESNLENWAEFYWHATDHPFTVRIEARPQEVEIHKVSTTLFSRNYSVSLRQGCVTPGRPPC